MAASFNSTRYPITTKKNNEDDDFYAHHVFMIGDKVFSVPKMWKAVENNMTSQEPVWKFDDNLWSPVWGVAPRVVLDNPAAYPDDFRRILKADMQYPVIMYNGNLLVTGAPYYNSVYLSHIILDGYHRYTRANYEKMEYILVTYITAEQLGGCEI